MLTRRKFIASTLLAGPALATGAQPARTQPAKRMIVDAQVHLWKADSPDYPWEPGAKPQLPEPFTIERALGLMDEAGVDRVVIVPPVLNDRNDHASNDGHGSSVCHGSSICGVGDSAGNICRSLFSFR